MKRFLIICLLCVISAFLIPITVYYIKVFWDVDNDIDSTPSKGEVKVYFHNEDTVKNMNIEEYLYGVVSAEMPASFEVEALKAQAVAARSYTFYRIANPSPGHPNADVCTDFAHCKAYKTENELKASWRENHRTYSEKIKSAVSSTEGEIVTYKGEAAMAVFHSQTGGGKTENSKDVWGGDVPYLVSVESHGEENAPNFYSNVNVTFSELKAKLSEKYPDIILESLSEIEITELNEGGSVKNICFGNKTLSGRDVRAIFGLRSSCFNVECDKDSVTFLVSGYGHGVGMSQYGADILAKEGYNYIEILRHYYTGIELDMV